jgi:TolB protein
VTGAGARTRWLPVAFALAAAGATVLAVTAAVGSVQSALDQVALVTSVAGESHLAIIGADGTGFRSLTHPPGRYATPVWSPDGRRIAYVRMLGPAIDIYVMNADGGGQYRLARGPGDRLFPAWSPDGRRIVFEHRLNARSHLFVSSADASGARQLTNLPGRATAPVWSPDGRRIAFVFSPRGGGPGLYLVGASGGRPDQIVPDSLLLRPGVLHPAWSPDGRRLAFVERVGRAEQQVSIVNADGTGRARLTTGYAPAWSPDGGRLAFVVARVGDAQIYVMDVTSRAAWRLTPSGVNLLPSWSPDGRRLVFLSSRDGSLDIWTMHADGTAQRRLAPASGDLSLLPIASWRPR